MVRVYVPTTSSTTIGNLVETLQSAHKHVLNANNPAASCRIRPTGARRSRLNIWRSMRHACSVQQYAVFSCTASLQTYLASLTTRRRLWQHSYRIEFYETNRASAPAPDAFTFKPPSSGSKRFFAADRYPARFLLLQVAGCERFNGNSTLE